MKITFYKGICWAQVSPDEIKNEPFQWGKETIKPGHVFNKIGSKGRTSFNIKANIVYCGRNGVDLFFQPVDDYCNGFYIVLYFVDHDTMLAQTSSNGFYDIRF